MIHKHPNGSCSISIRGTWVPGVYENEKAARYAYQFDDEALWKLQQEANTRTGNAQGIITTNDLRSLVRRKQTRDGV